MIPIIAKKLIKKANGMVWHPLGLRLTLLKTVRKEIFAFNYDDADDALKHIDLIKPSTMVRYPGLVTLYQHVRYIEQNNVPGDFVECGVWKGGAAALMASAQLRFGTRRRQIHLFDSFEGLPKASGEKDGEKAQQLFGSQNGEGPEHSYIFPVDEAVSRDLLVNQIGYPSDHVIYHKGWFQDTVPRAKEKGLIKKIALLRLDGDLYHSTKVCLENLWDLVVPNGIIIIDDYRHFEGCKKATDEFIATLKFKPLLNHVGSSGIRYIIKNE